MYEIFAMINNITVLEIFEKKKIRNWEIHLRAFLRSPSAAVYRLHCTKASGMRARWHETAVTAFDIAYSDSEPEIRVKEMIRLLGGGIGEGGN